jgi:16S rRNA processing protein RimM
MEVENAWMHGDQLVLKFKGVDSISDAERLAGADVMIPLKDRAPAPEGEFYQADLLGCAVVDGTGRLLGLVEDWLETGAAPLIQVRTPQNKELLIPFAKSFLIDIDVAAKRIVVNLPEGLEDLN